MEKKVNTPPALVIRRVINAKRDKVFAAWTKPEIMSQWFIAKAGQAVVTNELRVGGRFQNKMIFTSKAADPKSADALTEVVHTGEYLEIIPPEKIVFTWNSPFVTNTRVTIELRDRGDSTELTLTHELLETEDLRQKHNGGWEGCLTNLANYLE